MSLLIHLLGRPRAERPGADTYQFRSRKSWAVLAYLILGDRPPTRSQLAALLFADADDPLRALRWTLSEIRRCLGDDGSVDGDPVSLVLAPDVVVDLIVLTRGTWSDAVALPGLGAELLDGMAIRGAAAFESWLLSEQRRAAAASEAVLHEAAAASLSHAELAAARGYAVAATAMNPLDENHQALLIRLYRLAGEDAAAEQQYAACVELFERALGVRPGPAVEAALRTSPAQPDLTADPATIDAIIEAGSAAVSAGAIESGVGSLRTAIRLADGADLAPPKVRARLLLAEALIHSLAGLDEEGLGALHEADRIALADGDRAAVAQARAELGYVDFLRANYDRATRWLTEALRFADTAPATRAKALTYLGAVESDRANYDHAEQLLTQAVDLARQIGDRRRESFGRSMLGRIDLLRGQLDAAAEQLDASIDLARRDHWLTFLPWPQALRGEVSVLSDDPGAGATLTQAFARACQLDDPCWEGISARGLALVAAAADEPDRAFEILADARVRCNRLPDTYAWVEVYILDAQCGMGRRYRHPDTDRWVGQMRERAARTGMRELLVRAMVHGAAIGNPGDGAAAGLLAADIANPMLAALLPASVSAVSVSAASA